MEKQFTVAPEEVGQRLDRWLCAKLKGFSRNQVKELLDGGRVLVNSRRVVIAGWEVEAEDEIEVRMPPAAKAPPSMLAPCAAEREEGPAASPSIHHHADSEIRASIERHFERIKTRAPREPDRRGRKEGQGKGRAETESRRLRIYHEDRDIIVVEKPAGILSSGSSASERGEGDMVGLVKAYMRRRHRGSRHSFVAPIHRLDADTSGIMAFALSRAGQRLERQFRDHSVQREYTALVAGRVEEAEGVIDFPIEKGEFHGGRKVRRAEAGEGKKAITEYRVKERYAGATLLAIRVRTGRTHQIRLHLAEKGHPLIGDKVYGKGGPLALPAAKSLSRHALHAHTLGFKHPSIGKNLLFHSPLPDDMRELIERLRQG